MGTILSFWYQGWGVPHFAAAAAAGHNDAYDWDGNADVGHETPAPDGEPEDPDFETPEILKKKRKREGGGCGGDDDDDDDDYDGDDDEEYGCQY